MSWEYHQSVEDPWFHPIFLRRHPIFHTLSSQYIAFETTRSKKTNFTSSDPQRGINVDTFYLAYLQSDVFPDILSDTFYLVFCLAFYLTFVLTFYLAIHLTIIDILSGILSDSLSGSLSGMVFGSGAQRAGELAIEWLCRPGGGWQTSWRWQVCVRSCHGCLVQV